VQEGATAEGLRLRPLHHPVEELERALRRRRVGEVGLDGRADADRSAFEVRRQKLILAPDVLIERRLRRAGTGERNSSVFENRDIRAMVGS
jgi:hypothetical protein